MKCSVILPVFLLFLFILIPLLHKSHVIDVEYLLQQYYTKAYKQMDFISTNYKNVIIKKSHEGLYYNLSCPLEWSKYSCIHQNNTIKANLSYNYYMSMHKNDVNYFLTTSLRKRRIFLVGDSLMRQIFISIGCLTMSNIKSFNIDWMESWPCHGTANCIESNVHSGFNLGKIEFENGNEVYFKPLHGSMGRYDEPKMISRFMKELLSNGYISYGSVFSIPSNQLQMTSNDILVINLGVHDNGNYNSINYNELSVLGSKILSLQKNTNTTRTVPRLIYITSPSQHFGPHGVHDAKSSFNCLSNITHNVRNELEYKYFKVDKNVNGIINFNDTNLGDMHIGNGDCTHYCQPGLPDIIAEELMIQISNQP